MTITLALLIGLAWKSAVVAGLTLGLLRLARKRSSAERSMIAHFGLVALLALPLAALALPQWAPLPALPAAGAEQLLPAATLAQTAPAALPATAAETVAAPEAGFALPAFADLAIWLYLVPLALLAAAMAVSVLRLFGMRGRAEVLVDALWLSAMAEAQRRMRFKSGAALLVSEELRSPISWGVMRPTIVLNPGAVDAVGEAEAIIAHELAHVVRLDWAKLLAARVACALFWFNPLVWLLARESHQLREEAADDAVLLADVAGTDYATLLVNAARHDNQGALLAAHGVAPGRDSLKRRITRVLDRNVRRGPSSGGWAMVCLVALFGLAMPLAAFSTERAVRDAESAAEGSAPRPLAAVQPIANAAPVSAPQDAHAPISPDDLVAMRAVGVTPEFVAKVRAEAPETKIDDIVAAKAVGIDADYARQMRAVFGEADIGELAAARSLGIDVAYANAIRREFPGVDLDEVIGARGAGVTVDYAREMRRYFPDVELDELTGMRAVGVTGAYIDAMRKAGVPLRDADQALSMRAISGPRGSQAAREAQREREIEREKDRVSAKREAQREARASAFSSSSARVKVRPDGSTAISEPGRMVKIRPDGSASVVDHGRRVSLRSDGSVASIDMDDDDDDEPDPNPN